MLYLFTKWLHIVAIISWMAGILYLYRILIYQAERGAKPEARELLDTMGTRLYRLITMPAMGIAILAGIALIVQNPELMHQGWLHAKLTAVVILLGSTVYAGRLVRRFRTREGALPTSKTLRILNEVPTLLMLIIVGLVIFRPF